MGEAEKARGVTGEAASAISAHFCFASVGVEIAHFEVGLWGISDFGGDEAIGSDASVSVTKASNDFALEGELSGAVIDHDEVVPSAIHFGES